MNAIKVILVVAAAFVSATTGVCAKQTLTWELPSQLSLSNVNSKLDLDYGLRVIVRSKVNDEELLSRIGLPKWHPNLTLAKPVKESVEQYLTSYSNLIGFNGGANLGYFTLRVNIEEYNFRVAEFNEKKKKASSSATMIMRYELLNPNNQVVIPLTTLEGHDSTNQYNQWPLPFYNAYLYALDKIDWNNIAEQMKIAKTAVKEKNKEVEGLGDSALEHTVIRWFIVSAPQGADVYWRVISSTPDVSNSNSNYVGTTPYESTEAFDIKGLTYNNSGNVQIEVACEKPGYITQRKRFNLRQAIDQKEISAKFNLIKEEDEE